VKGRKRGGGGRIGEMERDALISHGTPFLMQDRFMDCSDKSTVSIYSFKMLTTCFVIIISSFKDTLDNNLTFKLCHCSGGGKIRNKCALPHPSRISKITCFTTLISKLFEFFFGKHFGNPEIQMLRFFYVYVHAWNAT